jgi:predicted Zn-dependent protease
MKKQIILVFLILSPVLLLAQLNVTLEGVVIDKISYSLIEGQKVRLNSFKNNHYQILSAAITYDGKEEAVAVSRLDRIKFTPNNLKEFWQIKALEEGVYQSIIEDNGLQYKLRKELEEDALDYLRFAERNGLLFEDSYLKSYLFSLAYRIYPTSIEDGRPGILNIKIIKDTAPRAFIFANGTMFLSTGLLSTLESEAEIMAVMAHEISHFVLDHSVININAAAQRQKRAVFWAGMATAAAAATEVYLASNNDYYYPGALTVGTGILAYSIASSLNERMGLEYSRDQETNADMCAVELMKFIKVDATALSSALAKIKEYSILNGNYYAISGEGTHPAINERIIKIGKPTTDFKNVGYDKKISFVNSFNAIAQFNDHHLNSCSDLVNRNINAGVATEDDYILLAMLTMYMFDNEDKNTEALSYLNIAKNLNITPSLNLHKQEAIVLIRLKRYPEAIEAFKKYSLDLESERLKLDQIKNSQEWSMNRNYISKEMEWSTKMIHKVKSF